MLAFYTVNFFFTQKKEERKRQWLQQQQETRVKAREQLFADVSQRTAAVEELGLVRVFADGEEFICWGIRRGKNVLTIAWNDTIPSEVFVEGLPLSLASKTVRRGDVVLYAAETPSLNIGLLPDLGKFDLQLVTIDGDIPQVHLAEYTDGRVSLPLHEDLMSDALVLLKSHGKYMPVGVFRYKEGFLQELEEFEALTAFLVKPPRPAVTPTAREEEYFVLENQYQQLVFSNKGGALVEINLPFYSDDNPQSVVRSIDFDKKILEQSPRNALFPRHRYYTPGEPHVEHKEGVSGGYYPLLRRDVVDGKESKVPASRYALNIVSQYPEVAELIYEVKAFEPHRIVFEAVQPHRRITKTYTVESGAPYVVHLDIKVDGDSRGLWLTSGIPEVELFSGRPAPAVKVRITRADKGEVEQVSLPKDALTVSSFNPDWACNSNGFFGMIVDPLTKVDAGYMVQHVPGVNAVSRLLEVDRDFNRFKASDFPGYNVLVPLSSQGGTMRFRIFAGPFSESILKAVDAKFADPTTGYTPDYVSSQSFHGLFSFISQPFAKFLFILMKFFYQVTNSWAVSIVLLTVALRLMLYPLNAWSMKSMRRMQQIAPHITAIQEKHKKDPKKAQLEVMALYREAGANPLLGCFPMIIQLPFLIGMFDLLKSTFDLRGVSFIPGWIDNLTAPDVLFQWNVPIMFIGNEFHLLPILLGLIMFVQQKMMSPGVTDPSKMTDQQRQQKAMGTIMPVLFTVMFYKFASGLNIYWLSSMVLGILQQWWTNRRLAKMPEIEIIPAAGRKTKAKAKP